MRASYRHAVQWIAINDNTGNGDTEEDVRYYVTTGSEFHKIVPDSTESFLIDY